MSYQSIPYHYRITFEPPTISLSPNGERIYVGNEIQRDILDTETLESILNLQDADILFYTIQWNSDGSEIAFRRGDGRATEIYDSSNGNLLRSFSSEPWGFGFFNKEGLPIWSPDDTYFAGVIGGNIVVVLDALSGEIKYQHQFDNEDVVSIAWSPDGSDLALSTRANVPPLGSPGSVTAPGSESRAVIHSLKIIEANSGNIKLSISGLQDFIYHLEWNPNGLEILSWDGFLKIYVWDADTGSLVDSYLLESYLPAALQYSLYGGRVFLGYDTWFDFGESADSTFVPISTFRQTQLDGAIEFFAPAASPSRAESILSQCVTDPAVVEAGKDFINAGQYTEFNQWVDQQSANDIPPVCADDLKLVVEDILFDLNESQN